MGMEEHNIFIVKSIDGEKIITRNVKNIVNNESRRNTNEELHQLNSTKSSQFQ